MIAADQIRRRNQDVVRVPAEVVRNISRDEAQNVAAVLINAQETRCSVKVDAIEMLEQGCDECACRFAPAPNGRADPHHRVGRASS